MNVYVPFGVTNIGRGDGLTEPTFLEAVRLNLEIQGIQSTYVEMTNDHSYPVMLDELWEIGKPFVIVEHDILPWPGAIQEMWTCTEPWCGFPYALPGGLDAYLGCTKFDPWAFSFPPKLREPEATFQYCDQMLAQGAARVKIEMHRHGPPVVHLHPGYDATKIRNVT